MHAKYMEVMKMKKILACMLCLALFTGCGNDDAKNNKTNSSSDNNVTENNTNTNHQFDHSLLVYSYCFQ